MILLALLACAADVETYVSRPPFVRQPRQCEPGVVTEVLSAGPYSYVGYNIASDGEVRWLASLALQEAPATGSTAEFVRYGQRQDFHSDRLDRDFPVLFFGFLGTC
ncbi:MAG: hypothetical protein ACI8RZ_007240 [Myxococcota bacterium]|jgi:hypothetical protein